MARRDPSNSKVDRAGALLRRHHSGDTQPAGPVADAEDTIERFRSRFLEPYLTVRESLQSIANASHPGSFVTARPKRFERIVEKLIRQPRLRLSQMQDIGGARLVLPMQPMGTDALAPLTRLAEEVRASWPQIRAVDDYVEQPRTSGYRAVHIVVVEASELVEIQLRTYRQHLWAELSEGLSRSQGQRLDLGEGPEYLLSTLRQASDAQADLDRGALANEIVAKHGWAAVGAALIEILRDYPRSN